MFDQMLSVNAADGADASPTPDAPARPSAALARDFLREKRNPQAKMIESHS